MNLARTKGAAKAAWIKPQNLIKSDEVSDE